MIFLFGFEKALNGTNFLLNDGIAADMLPEFEEVFNTTIDLTARLVDIYSYSLIGENIKDKNIFRVSLEAIGDKAEPKMDVFVSEKFKQTVRDAGLTGFKFVEVPVR